MTVSRADMERIKIGVIIAGPRRDLKTLLETVEATGLTLCRVRSGPENADFEIIQSIEIQAFQEEIARLRCIETHFQRRYDPTWVRSKREALFDQRKDVAAGKEVVAE